MRDRHGEINADRRLTVRKVIAATGLSGLVLGLILVTIAFVGGDTVVSRIEKLGGEVEAVDNTRVNRHLIWNSTLELIKDKPILGSGFGGYAAAIPAFDASGGKYTLESGTQRLSRDTGKWRGGRICTFRGLWGAGRFGHIKKS